MNICRDLHKAEDCLSNFLVRWPTCIDNEVNIVINHWKYLCDRMDNDTFIRHFRCFQPLKFKLAPVQCATHAFIRHLRHDFNFYLAIYNCLLSSKLTLDTCFKYVNHYNSDSFCSLIEMVKCKQALIQHSCGSSATQDYLSV